MSVLQLFEMFPDDETVERWFVRTRWPEGVHCPYCQSKNVCEKTVHKTMPFRCNDCKKWFSAKSKSVMHSSKLEYQKWAVATYSFVMHPQGDGSIQLHKELSIMQRSAWYMNHRIRIAYNIITEPNESTPLVSRFRFGSQQAPVSRLRFPQHRIRGRSRHAPARPHRRRGWHRSRRMSRPWRRR